MEYFLPLSVMAMIISSISIFLLESNDQSLKSNTDSENNQSSSNSIEKIEQTDNIDEDNLDEFTHSEDTESLEQDINFNNIPNKHSRTKFHSTEVNLRTIQQTYNILWDSKPALSTNQV